MNTEEELPHCVRSSLETVPGEQEVQEAAPVCSAIEFSAHFVQIVIVLSRYVPALQATERFISSRSAFYFHFLRKPNHENQPMNFVQGILHTNIVSWCTIKTLRMTD